MHDNRQDHLAWLNAHVSRLDERIRRLSDRSRLFSRIRGGYALVGFLSVFFVFREWSAEAGWGLLLALSAIFYVITRVHRKVEERLRGATVRRSDKKEQIARAQLDWDGIPTSAAETPHPRHPFRDDLDLTGPHSLHDLLDSTASAGASLRLSEWLVDPEPDPDDVLARQRLVRELVPLTIFRDGLKVRGILSGDKPGTTWEGASLLRWVERSSEADILGRLLRILSALALLNIILVVATLANLFPNWWLYSLPVYAGVYLLNHRRVGHFFHEASDLERALSGFGVVANFLEQRPYCRGSRLESLCAPFLDPVRRPSTHLNRIGRIAAAASSQSSEILTLVVNLIGPWDLYFGWRLEQARELLGTDITIWLDCWHELEAHCALATFASLNPEHRFPELVSDESGEAPFRAEELGHPLVPHDSRVTNDLTLKRAGHHILLTGSNMSGKSTFLRTVGVTLSLAYAGAPVAAAFCRLRMLRLFTCIQVADSLEDGYSFFYAEVSRLRALLDELEREHPRPLVFLIDEIFRGTNNRERLIGSRAYLKTVIGSNGLGMIATHDLELADFAETSSALENRHFRDDIVDGRMAFDYKLHDGPCPTTNALRIMRSAGLPVELD